MSRSSTVAVLVLAQMAFFGAGCRSLLTQPPPLPRTTVARSVRLGEAWLEITPVQPLEATARIHFLGLRMAKAKGWADDARKRIRFEDGREIEIDVALVAENGTETRLYPNGFAELVEFGKRAENRENVEDADFQKGVRFTKIRLRSDKPVEIEEVVWMEFEF
ncbi:MAG: hypothetical protein IPN69_05255 [Acidobacteria bacterium]|nr:hypothetical protein [Acidobacteriota bacterium]MBK8810124.1 hypothetical protein [Acidobacteriota bacterium]